MNSRKKILLILISILLFVSCNNEVVVVYDISKERFQREVAAYDAKYEKYLIIDTRTEAEYRNGHIVDALNYSLTDLNTRFYEIEDLKNVRTYVYGNTADESFAVAKYLGQHGYKTILNCAGVNEAEYEFVMYHPVRLPHGFEIAKNFSYQLFDYRTKIIHDQYTIPNANFLAYPNIEDLLDAVTYATGYVVFSTNVKHAKECAAKLVDYGFRNVYYCIDNILDYPKYFEYTERQLEVDETSNETPAP